MHVLLWQSKKEGSVASVISDFFFFLILSCAQQEAEALEQYYMNGLRII